MLGSYGLVKVMMICWKCTSFSFNMNTVVFSGLMYSPSLIMFALMYRNKVMGKISTSLSSIKFLHFLFHQMCSTFFYRNDCGVFVIKYMKNWNGAVLTHAIDSVYYISKVLKLYALILD